MEGLCTKEFGFHFPKVGSQGVAIGGRVKPGQIGVKGSCQEVRGTKMFTSPKIWKQPVLVSYGCCNKLPRISWLKKTDI